jgi:deoxyuridine 5'-triphosphate nucleotidohydrolase
MPRRATNGSAGYDLHALEGGKIYAGEQLLVKTGITFLGTTVHMSSGPEGWFGMIKPRSGLAYKHCIDVMAGVIDADYREDIGVILRNKHRENTFDFTKGDRIAQIIIIPCYMGGYSTEERDGGFGSTGIDMSSILCPCCALPRSMCKKL